MVKECTTMAELSEALAAAGDKLVVVDFFATWCGPCKAIAPKIAAWESDEKMSDVVFLKVDVDKNDQASEEYEVEAMPTFKLIRKGAVTDTVVGADHNALQQMILSRIEQP